MITRLYCTYDLTQRALTHKFMYFLYYSLQVLVTYRANDTIAINICSAVDIIVIIICSAVVIVERFHGEDC